MRKLVLIVLVFCYFTSYSQSNRLKSNYKNKYDNFFFRSPGSYNNKEQVFKVTKILFSTTYDGAKSENNYQIAIYGNVNNNKETVIHNVKSSKDLAYYKKVFSEKYKKILVFNYRNKVGSKIYYDTSISVEF